MIQVGATCAMHIYAWRLLDAGIVAGGQTSERTGVDMRQERENVSRTIALVLGLGYVVIGLVGFAVTGFTGFVENTDETLLGFDLNVFHNIVHVAIGAGLLLAASVRYSDITQGVVIGVGLFYILAAVLGFLNELQIISINDELAADNFLHAISGLALFVFGVLGVRRQDEEADRVRPTYMPASLSAGAPGTRGGPLPIEERRALWDRSRRS